MSSINTCVFPVAGLGTRFLPATKSVAKEMLTIVDEPIIQYAAEEAVAAGIKKLVFIVGRTKNSIIDHFDKAYELETELKLRDKQEQLEILRKIVPEGVQCVFIRQAEALGLGHAVLCAEPAVGKEDFAVILPDDLIYNDAKSVIAQMCEVYEYHKGSVIGTQTVPIEESKKYGMIAGHVIEPGLAMVDEIIEKPAPQDAPSDQGVVGRYVLTNSIFDHIRSTGRGAGNEYQLTDAIASLRNDEPVFAYSFKGKRYDCGSKIGYLEATVEYALKHEDLKERFGDYLRELVEKEL